MDYKNAKTASDMWSRLKKTLVTLVDDMVDGTPAKSGAGPATKKRGRPTKAHAGGDEGGVDDSDDADSVPTPSKKKPKKMAKAKAEDDEEDKEDGANAGKAVVKDKEAKGKGKASK